MEKENQIHDLIEAAAEASGSLRKLATALDMNPSNLVEMKQGKRPANWRVRGKLRVILGQDPAHAFVAAMAEDLAASDNADEKKAAAGFEAMLAAFPDGWRKRMNALAALTLQVLQRLRGPVDRSLCSRFGYTELHA